MSPIAHFIGSWLVAAVAVDNPRDRRLVTLAGVLPDADGLGMVVDAAKALSSGQEMNFLYYQKFHHLWLHGWPGALMLAMVLACFAQQRWRVALGCLVTFHLHLLGDLLGSRGPSPADLWPICYGEPLFQHPVWFWKGQWRLDGWQNTVICLALFGLALRVTVKRGHSFAEIFGQRADAAFTSVLQKWSKSALGWKSSQLVQQGFARKQAGFSCQTISSLPAKANACCISLARRCNNKNTQSIIVACLVSSDIPTRRS